MLKIISFNIRCCDDPDGNSIVERAARLKQILLPYSADIIALQEYRPDWEKPISDIFSDAYDIFNLYRAKDELEGSPVLWKRNKFSLEETDHFWLSDTPLVESKGWDELCDCYRMCVCFKFRETATGETFRFLNTHFGFGDDGQVKSAKLIKDYCANKYDEPICLVGDFNMEPDSPGYKEITKSFDDINLLTAKDMRNTYHGYNPLGDNGEHIDYCFINKNFHPLTRKLIDETVDGKFPSDHFGLFIDIE